MHQSYDKSRTLGGPTSSIEPDVRVGRELPEGALEQVIEISKRRAEFLGNMKDALLRGDIETVWSIAEVLCGLADYE